METRHHDDHRFCFFIDGLDEYAGNGLAHEELAMKLKAWTAGGDIKICTSSRPYQAYVELFDYPCNPPLHLHLLNRTNIRAYCLSRIGTDHEVRKSGVSYKYLAEKK